MTKIVCFEIVKLEALSLVLLLSSMGVDCGELLVNRLNFVVMTDGSCGSFSKTRAMELLFLKQPYFP